MSLKLSLLLLVVETVVSCQYFSLEATCGRKELFKPYIYAISL